MSDFEYNCDTYPSFGKKYNNEKAIISLTSWKARINTVSKTLYSLVKQCPGFHIVLVLSEEEFPKMMEEMPDNLKLFADNEMIEFLWVYKNYKAFKKVLFTMDKYREVPIVSADDDCIYTYNYAQELYDKWLKFKTKQISYNVGTYFNKYFVCCGPCTLYPPAFYKLDVIDFEKLLQIKPYNDDWFYATLKHIQPHSLSKNCPFVFHDTLFAMTTRKYNNRDRKSFFKFYEGCRK